MLMKSDEMKSNNKISLSWVCNIEISYLKQNIHYIKLKTKNYHVDECLNYLSFHS